MEVRVLNRVANAPQGDDGELRKIRELSNDFESIFLEIVLKSMRDTVPKDGLMSGGNAEDIYRSMLDSEYAKNMAQQRVTGIADQIERFMLQSLGKESSRDNVGTQNLEHDTKRQISAIKQDGLKAYAAEANKL